MLISTKKTYFIGSGKGGVGKSTVAVNLAVALAQKGLTVGLFDADIYGPSIPIMMGLRRLSPRIHIDTSGKEIIIPFTKFGVKVISIGFFLEEARSLMWRGPMLHGTLQRMLNEVEWGPFRYIVNRLTAWHRRRPHVVVATMEDRWGPRRLHTARGRHARRHQSHQCF